MLLLRGLGLRGAIAVVVGSMIGSGIYLKPAEVARDAGSAEAAMAAWVVGALLTLAGALAFSELGTMMPAAGGDYVFLRRAFGPLTGFLWGWTTVAVGTTTTGAALAAAFGLFAGYLWPPLAEPVITVGRLVVTGGQLVGLAALAAVVLVNCLEIWKVGRIEWWLTVIKVAALVIAILAGIAGLGGGAPAAPAAAMQAATVAGFTAAVTATLWTYSGWEMLLWVGGEVKDPARTIPRAMVGGFAVTAVLFLLLNLACLAVLGYDAVAGSPHVVSDLLERSLGDGVSAILTGVMMISVVGSLNAATLAASRVPYALARDGLLPPLLAWLHPDRRVPIPAVVAPAIGAAVLLLTGTFEQLTSLFVFSQWLFYAVAIAALFRLRWQEPDAPRPVKAWGYPFVPGLFFLLAVLLTVAQVAGSPARSLLGLGVMVAGIPLYLANRR